MDGCVIFMTLEVLNYKTTSDRGHEL